LPSFLTDVRNPTFPSLQLHHRLFANWQPVGVLHPDCGDGLDFRTYRLLFGETYRREKVVHHPKSHLKSMPIADQREAFVIPERRS
jgi:hypothetical protein